MGKYSDSNPVGGAKRGGGKKNNDGRENGAKYDRQDKAVFSPKDCGVEPNKDSKPLDGKRKGIEKGAY